jgi:hypothetical protein
VNGGSDVFLVCVLLALVVCTFWREMVAVMVVLGVAAICMAIFYVALGVQSVAQAS